MGEKKQKQGFLKTGSIDDIFSEAFEKKEKAISLLGEERHLDQEELRHVAEAVYETTFAKLFYADYSVRRNTKNKTEDLGAETREIDALLEKEVNDYLNTKETRLAKPAWWFASRNMWTIHLETGIIEMTGINGNPEKNIRGVFERYKEGFENNERYLVSNIKIILGYEDGN